MGEIKNGKFIRQWEIDGTRRPFPPLYEAAKKYGNRIFYRAPEYTAAGFCKFCGNPLPNKRRKSFCSDECSIKYSNVTVWHRRRDAYSLRILYRDNFTCQECGEFHALKNEYGVYLPVDDGKLNVHHINLVTNEGDDSPENLVTLCVSCHKKQHSKR